MMFPYYYLCLLLDDSSFGQRLSPQGSGMFAQSTTEIRWWAEVHLFPFPNSTCTHFFPVPAEVHFWWGGGERMDFSYNIKF